MYTTPGTTGRSRTNGTEYRDHGEEEAPAEAKVNKTEAKRKQNGSKTDAEPERTEEKKGNGWNV